VISHWPNSGSPAALSADTSAEMVLRWIDAGKDQQGADVVSNNHFDEDGLVSVWAITHPDAALAKRELLSDVARAGDFGTYRFRDAARLSFAIAALADPATSPFEASTFGADYAATAAALYRKLLGRLPELIADVGALRSLWEPEDAYLEASEAALASGEARLEEQPDVDLAVVVLPEQFRSERVHRFTQPRDGLLHPMAIHNATSCFRVAIVRGRRYEVQYRYETWVQYASRRPMPRVDLEGLARRLDEVEGDSVWHFDGVDRITPRLRMDSARDSRIPSERFVEMLVEHLRSAPPAWNPYA
jgi:hypothetical protein